MDLAQLRLTAFLAGGGLHSFDLDGVAADRPRSIKTNPPTRQTITEISFGQYRLIQVSIPGRVDFVITALPETGEPLAPGSAMLGDLDAQTSMVDQIGGLLATMPHKVFRMAIGALGIEFPPGWDDVRELLSRRLPFVDKSALARQDISDFSISYNEPASAKSGERKIKINRLVKMASLHVQDRLFVVNPSQVMDALGGGEHIQLTTEIDVNNAVDEAVVWEAAEASEFLMSQLFVKARDLIAAEGAS